MRPVGAGPVGLTVGLSRWALPSPAESMRRAAARGVQLFFCLPAVRNSAGRASSALLLSFPVDLQGEQNMIRFARLVAMSAVVLSLTGCLLPEKFEASVNVKPDGGYTYKYEGTAVHLLAAAAIQDKGSLHAKDEDELKRVAEKAAKAPGFRKMTYTGNGRFDVQIDEDVKAGRQTSTLKIFNITRDKDGVFVLAAPPTKEKDRDQLRAFGIKVNGKAEVFLPGNAKVLEHNANGTPGLLSKSYSWKIGAVVDQPMIRFTLAP